MQPIVRDHIRIDRLVESEGPMYPPEMLLPTLPAEALDAERDWLCPRFFDPDAGALVMSVHSFVVRTGRYTVLVDACVGNDKERPDFGDWHHQQSPYLARLAALGLAPEDIDVVFCTHLHPDHVGWNTRLRDGRWIPTFPNARYLFARAEWEQWSRYADTAPEARPGPYPPPVSAVLADCYRDSVHPVVAAGLSELVDDGFEIERGLRVELAPGHTPGNAVVALETAGFRGLLSGDVLHHPLQVRYPEASSAFCFDRAASAATRRRILEEAAGAGRVLFPAHFPAPTAARIEPAGAAFEIAWESE